MTPQNHDAFGSGACEDVLAVSAESDRPCADSLEAGGQTAPISLFEGDPIKN